MDWTRYKAICNTPSVMSRWALETTRAQVEDADVLAAIDRVVGGDPIEKPVDHKGGSETDCFEPCLPAAMVETILRSLQHQNPDDERMHRLLGHLGVVWREYRDSLSCAGSPPRD